SATPTANLYTAGAITVLTSASQGSRRIFSFASPTPNAPSNNLVSGITQTSLTLNWLDNSANELGFVVYRSTDLVNYSFIAQTAANSTSFTDTGLNPGTNYFYTVQALTEGALSTITSFSGTTLPAGNDTCNGAGGNWSVPATWTDGSVPTSADNVTIGSGCTATVDTAASALTVGIQSGGVLQFELTNAQTLTVAQAVVVNSGGILQSNPAGAQAGHVLSIGTNLTNNGTIDFSTNGNTAGAGITFTGAADATA